MSSLSNSEVTMVTSEGSVLANQTEKSVENKNDTEQTSLTSLKTPVVIVDNGKQNIHNNSSRLLFQFNQNNISNIYALAQANLVQQTQQDIMKMFSAEYSDHFTVKEVESSSPKEKCVIIKKDQESKAKEEQLVCNVKGCGRSFASLGHMRNHQLMHEKEKALECHYKGCGRKFSWPAHLKYHLLTHENTKTFKCLVENCDKSFVTGQQLKVHSRTHTGERPFKCDQCLKAFSTAGNLKNHIRTHTGDKPYECTEPKCHLRFAEYSSLKKHLLKHTGEKPFKCPVCSRSFTQSGSMRVHMKKHTQQDTSIEREPEYNVVMMEDNSTSNNIDYQVVFSDTVTDNVVTVTTEQQSDNLPVSNEMFLVEDLFTKRPSLIPDPSCPANVVVLPLPQLPVSMATSYQHIQTSVHEEIVLDESGFLHSEFDHEETACDISETEH